MKTKTLKRSITFPFVKGFDNHVDIEAYRRAVLVPFGDENSVSITSLYVGYDGNYYALFYIRSNKPEASDIIKLAQRAGLSTENLDGSLSRFLPPGNLKTSWNNDYVKG